MNSMNQMNQMNAMAQFPWCMQMSAGYMAPILAAPQQQQQVQQHRQGGQGGKRHQPRREPQTHANPSQYVLEPDEMPVHIDRIPISTQNSTIKHDLEETFSCRVLCIEDKRGQHTVHCCAFAKLKGAKWPEGETEVLIGRQMIRVQQARKAPDAPTEQEQARKTLHIRIMANRKCEEYGNWAFAISGLTWVGLAAALELVQEGLAANIHLVADDKSNNTSKAHPENFIGGFFVECPAEDVAEFVHKNCTDKVFEVGGVDFRVAAEFTRKTISLYDKPPRSNGVPGEDIRVKMNAEYRKAVAQAKIIMGILKVRPATTPLLVTPEVAVDGDLERPRDGAEVVKMFQFYSREQLVDARKPPWYARKYDEAMTKLKSLPWMAEKQGVTKEMLARNLDPVFLRDFLARHGLGEAGGLFEGLGTLGDLRVTQDDVPEGELGLKVLELQQEIDSCRARVEEESREENKIARARTVTLKLICQERPGMPVPNLNLAIRNEFLEALGLANSDYTQKMEEEEIFTCNDLAVLSHEMLQDWMDATDRTLLLDAITKIIKPLQPGMATQQVEKNQADAHYTGPES
eukprot:Hpha_TRINITY_DN14874_c0_g1::TRINITY_DN14874_c0_g1_i1::g.169088::m.169088